MENPATWGAAERIIHSVRVQHEEMMHLKVPVFGLSLERQITDALRQAGLLREETDDGGHPNPLPGS